MAGIKVLHLCKRAKLHGPCLSLMYCKFCSTCLSYFWFAFTLSLSEFNHRNQVKNKIELSLWCLCGACLACATVHKRSRHSPNRVCIITWSLSLTSVIHMQCRLGVWWGAQQGWAACRSCCRAWEAEWELPFCLVWKLVPPGYMQPGRWLWVCSRHWWSQVRENKCTSVMLYCCTMIHRVCSQHRCSQVTTMIITVTNNVP